MHILCLDFMPTLLSPFKHGANYFVRRLHRDYAVTLPGKSGIAHSISPCIAGYERGVYGR